MNNTFLFFTLLFSFLCFGQSNIDYALIDKKIAEIPQNSTKSTDSIAKFINSNFKTENDKIRAVFYWTASNISYDVENMYVVNFHETPEERIAKTLKTRKGICIDYANIFNKIANATGIKTVLISGYTKINDKVSNLSHAWCAAKIENKWYLFDPTWGSGFIISNKYTRKTKNTYFKVEPDLMISSHMPFDYLWQFINYPLTNQEFIEGVIYDPEKKEKFDFTKELIRRESLSKADQLYESSQRIEKGGMKNQLISQAYIDVTRQWNFEKDKESRDKFNEANSKVNAIVKQYNEAINDLNDFINYRNKQFLPTLPDEDIKRMIQEPVDKLAYCKVAISTFEKIEGQNQANIDNLIESISKTLSQAEEQLQFVNLYLSNPEPVRKSMFYKIVKTQKKIK